MTEQNYYRLLEVAESATQSDIQRAYELAKRTYSVESLATYSLFGAEERQAVMAKVEEAYRVLINPDRRREYDAWLTQTSKAGVANRADAGTAGGSTAPGDPVDPSELTIPDRLYGKDLKRLREQLGISLQSIANQTRINIKSLQYLEEEQHGKLPHAVFVRGYLLQYAQALGLDPDRVLAGYLNGMANAGS